MNDPAAAKRLCPMCGAEVQGKKAKVYCSAACQTRKWREKNRERHQENAKIWQKKNPEKFLGYVQKWRKKNPEKCQRYRQQTNLQQLTHEYLTLVEQLKEKTQ